MTGLTSAERQALLAAAEQAVSYRERVPEMPIPDSLGAHGALDRFAGQLNDEGMHPKDVIDHMTSDGEAGLLNITSPRFFGYVAGASDPVGVAADILVSAWGQNTAYSVTTPTTAAIERAVCGWVIDLLGLPDTCGAGLVTGGTVANTCGVMAARNHLLAQVGWDVEADGLYGAPEIQVVLCEETHSSDFAALKYAGLGSKRVHKVKANANLNTDVDDFKKTIAGLDGPILVILQAGHINSGGFDAFDQLISIAHEKGAWVHVDGAFGLWVNAVPALQNRLAGVERADSWAVDLHKWLNAPFGAGMIITKNRTPLVNALAATAAYLPNASGVWDPGDSTPELSRRALGVPSYAILRNLGKNGVREMVARHCRLAERVASEIEQEPGMHVVNTVQSNQVAIRCGEGEDADEQTRQVLATVQKNGRVYPSHGEWNGMQIIRVSIIAHKTGDAEIDELISELKQAWRRIRGQNHA